MKNWPFIFFALHDVLTTMILKRTAFRLSIFLRTLVLVIVFVPLSIVGNVQAKDTFACEKDSLGQIWPCEIGDKCIYNDAGQFAGCCGGTICGDRDATRVCCSFPTPNCFAPGRCAVKPRTLPDGPCKEPGCIIGAETQTLGEVIQVTGTPLSLNYQSNLASRRHNLGVGGWSFSVLHSYDPQGHTLYLGSGDQRNSTARNASSLPGSSSGDMFIPAEDGSELYVFSSAGRHLRTLDALTGAVRFQFSYDSADRLVTATDGDDNVTTIERDGSGNPSAIIAPFGQRTTLAVDTDGYLSRIENPAGEAAQFTYLGGFVKGFLATHTYPRGHTYRYHYDPATGLIRDDTPTGGTTNLARRDTTINQSSVTLTRASGQATTYEVEELPTGETRRRIDRSGVHTESLISPDGSRRQTYADGSVVKAVKGPDPRFGMEAPINKSQTLTTPGGLVRTATMERTASLANSTNPLSLTSQTTTVAINGRTYTRAYDASNHTLKDTTPGGRQRVITTDAKGRLIQSSSAGVASIQRVYDERGRLASLIQGDRTYTLTYDDQGYTSMITDPLRRAVSFTYDAAGRVTRQTLPDGRQIRYGYDSNGNMTSLAPSRRPSHVFTYTVVDQIEEYRPPFLTSGGNTRYNYDPDKRLTSITHPDGKLIDFGYETMRDV